MADSSNCFSMVKDLVLTTSAIVGSYVALSGLRAWKKQLLGKADYDLSRRFLLSTYKVREAIKTVRDPYIGPSEISESLKESGDTEYSAEKIDPIVYNRRWNKLAEAWMALEVELLEAEVSWGKDSRKRTKDLKRCVTSLRADLRKHLALKRKNHPSKEDFDKIEKIEETIYDIGSEENPDKFQLEVNKAIDEIENFLRQHLKV